MTGSFLKQVLIHVESYIFVHNEYCRLGVLVNPLEMPQVTVKFFPVDSGVRKLLSSLPFCSVLSWVEHRIEWTMSDLNVMTTDCDFATYIISASIVGKMIPLWL